MWQTRKSIVQSDLLTGSRGMPQEHQSKRRRHVGIGGNDIWILSLQLRYAGAIQRNNLPRARTARTEEKPVVRVDGSHVASGNQSPEWHPEPLHAR